MLNENIRDFLKLSLDERESLIFKKFPDNKILKETLLKLGGNRVIWLPNDPHRSLLLTQGKEFLIDKRKKIKGDINGCHSNVARLFMTKNIEIITGFALAEDRWLQHSWGFDGKKILETTVLFDKYYGVSLSGLDITKFVLGQLDSDEIISYPKDKISKLTMPNFKD